VVAALSGTALAQSLTTVRVAQGLTRPVFVTAPPGDASRLFIVEQRGSGGVSTQAQIKILKTANNAINAAPFLTLTGMPPGFEQGLLGLAFDPAYSKNGRFYVFYTDTTWNIVIARYTVSGDPDIANPGSTIILTQTKQFNNHNGGWIGFGPDGYLYASVGDGGSEFDPNGMGQSLTTIFGKILRSDVSGAGPGYTVPTTNPFFGSPTNRPEIWAYGLRNAFRCSFDRLTGDMFIADVGQDMFEEVNFRQRTFDPPFPALNYGWRCYEGNAVQNTTIGPGGTLCSTVTNFTFPIHSYGHGPGCSISGGYVYRGCAMPALKGTFFFADYCSAQITSFRYVGGVVQDLTSRTAELAVPGQTIDGVVSFGEDARGELYICDQVGGEIYKIVPRCPADCDGIGGLTGNDFQCFINSYVAMDCSADCDGVGGLTGNDFQCFLDKYVAGCS